MSLQETPRSNRLHIGIFGNVNSGKSSLLNALTNQEIALVSNVEGTTTDPIYKAMELQHVGPVVFIDTAGSADTSELGNKRLDKSLEAADKTDIAVLVFRHEIQEVAYWITIFKERKTPYILVRNVEVNPNTEQNEFLEVNAKTKQQIEKLRNEIIRNLPESYEVASITADLCSKSDLVLLVMPQDIQAPKGRLILPQVQTIRDLLDKKCSVMSCTMDTMETTLTMLSKHPDVIICDSQVFKQVYDLTPKGTKLTSFSVLFANYKGDMKTFIEGAKAIGKLNEQSRVLIAEACTHAPLGEDIGTVQIPKKLRERFGETLTIDYVRGNEFSKDLGKYDLIIHCGACMFNRKYVLSRIELAKKEQIPITNYGVTLAYLSGILDKIEL